jgi:hypothetical protein
LAFAILLGLEIEFYICPWHKNAAGAFAPAAVLLIWIFSTPTIDVELQKSGYATTFET